MLDETPSTRYNKSCPLRAQTVNDGELAEWSKAHDWKSCVR